MGKKQHQKDKMYLTCTEWTTIYGGRKANVKERATFRKLEFYCCSLSLQPFEHPLCTPDGTIYDLMSIVPYLKKYGHNPITGEPLDPKSLIKLNFHKNSDGKYHCPVTFKIFNENSHIVAIQTTGNVYSHEAVERLNVKTKNLRDLLTDELFQKSDIITLQDPTNLEKFDISSFHHIKNNLTIDEDEVESVKKDPTYFLRTLNPETRTTLEELYRDYKQPEKKSETKEKLTTRNAAHFSTGAVSRSFTSTVGAPVTHNEAAVLDRDIVRYRQIKKKGYVRLHTSKGDLNFELHCDLVTKTCENFIVHCKSGYYNGTIFHRSIRHFMIQGGDPTGTGAGGDSIWGKCFADEFKPNLVHKGRGILSMANSGPNTNKSQFFITYRSCQHLDNKHTVFGRLVGGLEVISEMEKVETDAKDRPLESITITGASVFVDPYQEVDDKLKEEDEKEAKAVHDREEDEAAASTSKGKGKEIAPKVHREGVGKYIPKPPASAKRSGEEGAATGSDPKRPKVVSAGSLGDFRSW